MKQLAKDILFGVAVADAIGAPVEFKQSSEINIEDVRSNYANEEDRLLGFGTWYKPIGTFTDDTSMTLCTAEYLAQDDYNLNILMQYFVDWTTSGKWTADGECFDIGGTVNKAIIHFMNNKDWRTSGLSDASSNGNGSLMRILPALLPIVAEHEWSNYHGSVFHEPIKGFFPNYTMDYNMFIADLSAITHSHSISVDCCITYLDFAEFLLMTKDKEEANKYLKDQRGKPLYSKYYDTYKLLQPLFADDFLKRDPFTFNANGYVLGTLEIAIYCLLTTNSYEEAVLQAVSYGGDTDTNAAVTGGLAAILYGYESIPAHWIAPLKQKNRIEKLAEELDQKFSILEDLDNEFGFRLKTEQEITKDDIMSFLDDLDDEDTPQFAIDEGAFANELSTDQDEIPQGIGEFGWDRSNPIPTSTVSANKYYLSNLTTTDGKEIHYKRLGSTQVDNIPHIIDVYEISCDDNIIGKIHLCPYHLKISEKSPKGLIAHFRN